MPLSKDERLLLGTAIAMAKADNSLGAHEEALLELLHEQMKLDAEGQREVRRMLKTPPSAEELAGWAITELDRVGVYATALKVAQVDGIVMEEEVALLERLAGLLKLSPVQIKAAAAYAKEGSR